MYFLLPLRSSLFSSPHAQYSAWSMGGTNKWLLKESMNWRHGSRVSSLGYCFFCLGLIWFGLNTVEWRKQRSQTGSQDAQKLSYTYVFFGLDPCLATFSHLYNLPSPCRHSICNPRLKHPVHWSFNLNIWFQFKAIQVTWMETQEATPYIPPTSMCLFFRRITKPCP